MRFLATLTAVTLTAFLVGCSANKNGDNGSTDSASQQAATASQTLGVLTDASVETLLSNSTGGESVKALSDGSEVVPDLKALSNATITIDLATFLVNGQPLFPGTKASGTITVTSTGTALGSWPVGTTQLFTGSVSVTLANIVVDVNNGDSLSIPSGTFIHTLDITSTKTDDRNWILSWNANATVSPVLNASLTRGSKTHTLTLGGERRVQAEITRAYAATSGTVTTNTRTAKRTISGPINGADISSNAAVQTLPFSNWVVTVDGQSVTWNRNAQLTTAWDYTKLGTGTAFSVTTASDSVFITTGSGAGKITVGPFTAVQAAALLRAKLDSASL